MTTQKERAEIFHSLHVKGKPLIIYNIWDAGTAKALEEIEAKAIATGSWAVAASHGYVDGEALSLDLAVENLKRIVSSVNIPVSIDFEAGYGKNPDDVRRSVSKAIEAGAVGINLEDRIARGDGLYTVQEQCERIRAIRAEADRASIPFFINARTDVFLQADPASHGELHMKEAALRGAAYADAGGSGFFVPGLKDAELIGRICSISSLPVNILAMSDTPPARKMADLGVARISYGATPYRRIIEAFQQSARDALALK